MGKITFLLGGARSGKSTFAEEIARAYSGRVVYIATAQSLDDEMANRIKSHQQKRPAHWLTMEFPVKVAQSFQQKSVEAELVLLDCLTLLISNILMEALQIEGKCDQIQTNLQVKEEIEQLCSAAEDGKADWLIVSNEVGMGLVPPNPMGRIYRDLLGWANQRIASSAQKVYLLVAGIPLEVK